MDPKDRRPAEWPDLDVHDMLHRLTSAGVDFVVIGGIALILHGSARLTRDLDIVFAPDDANLDALGKVLVDMKAQLREADEGIPFVPDGRTLRNVELLTLVTSAGWLDVHRRPKAAPRYETLRRNAERVDVGGFSVLVASPDDLIAMKSAAARPRDLSDLEELEAVKRLRHRPDQL
ncbi:MAG: nucleotidyl transferase AbiEii/AbiGii toxin family protein [Solirubrobacterales bacterium]